MSRNTFRETLLCLLAAAVCLGGFCTAVIWIARTLKGTP